MAHIFTLHDLYRQPDDAFTFDVGRADVFCVGEGTKEWVRGAMAVLGVPMTGPFGWTVTAQRAVYRSPYILEQVWQDRWQRLWSVRVVPGTTITTPADNRPPGQFEWYGETDPTEYVGEFDDGTRCDPRCERAALVMFDFRGTPADAHSLIREVLQGIPSDRPPPTIEVRPCDGECQTRLRFEPVAFPDDLPWLDGMVERLRVAGACVGDAYRASWLEDARRAAALHSPALREYRAWLESIHRGDRDG